MVLGFNHNVMYKGEVFHIQTEDSGLSTPHIITLLYRGGTILASKKTSYADIIKIENLESVVEELMKEQHKDMMRRLKGGEYDERAFPPEKQSARPPEEERMMAAEVVSSTPSHQRTSPENANSKMSLDEIILDYLVVDGDK